MSRPASIMLLVALLAAACTEVGQDLFDPLDEVPPQVIQAFPGDGWRQVPVGITVRVWFSEAVDPSTVSNETLALFSGEALAEMDYQVSVLADGRGLVELTPVRPLIPGVLYTLVASDGITDLVGNALEPASWLQFTTAW